MLDGEPSKPAPMHRTLPEQLSWPAMATSGSSVWRGSRVSYGPERGSAAPTAEGPPRSAGARPRGELRLHSPVGAAAGARAPRALPLAAVRTDRGLASGHVALDPALEEAERDGTFRVRVSCAGVSSARARRSARGAWPICSRSAASSTAVRVSGFFRAQLAEQQCCLCQRLTTPLDCMTSRAG